MSIEVSTIGFLRALARHNDRAWFLNNKEQFLRAQQNVTGWLDTLIAAMNQHDQLQTQNGKQALYRIHRDVRFSDDKTPYNPRFAGHLKRQKPFLRGGYYFWIQPGASRIGAGFTYPKASDLLRIRQDIDLNYNDWRKILRQKKVLSIFGEMQGDHVKTTPRGFPNDHPAIDLLRFKQFWFEKTYTDAEVTSKTFLKQVNNDFKAIRPFFDYMTEVLTTDTNGRSLI